MTPEDAKAATERFIGGAKGEALERFDLALRKIARMTWWQRLWHASDFANLALGTGRYWDRGWKIEDVL